MQSFQQSYQKTPKKIKQKYVNQNIPSTTIKKQNHLTINNTINYKIYTFELMNQIMILKLKLQSYQNHIQTLNDKISSFQYQINSFLKKITCNNFKDALSMIRQLQKYKSINLQQHTQIKNKQFINTSIQNTKIQQKLKQHYTKSLLKQLSNFSSNHFNQLSQIQLQNNQIKLQLSTIKYQYQILICQNTQLKQHVDQLRIDLKRSIDNYQHIQIQIQDKMKLYIDKIKQYQQIIQKSQYPIITISQQKPKQQQQHEFHFNKSDFSFGKQSDTDNQIPQNKKQQKISQIQDLKLNIQCYRASIQGLLQQNKRLKKSFQLLNQLKQGQSLPQDLIKQIDIMKSIMELGQNFYNL